MIRSAKTFVALVTGALLCVSAFSQEPLKVASSYTPYPDVETPCTRPPAGYKPFYLSSFGRHGSRYLIAPDAYEYPLRVLEEAERGGFLTETGQQLLRDVRLLAEDARGMYGTLLPLGGLEHRHIMERTTARYPAIFSGNNCRIDVYSSRVHRCLVSMAYSLDAITAANPRVVYDRHCSDRIQDEVFTSYQTHVLSQNILKDYDAEKWDRYGNDGLLDKIFTYNDREKDRYLTPEGRKRLPRYFWELTCESVLHKDLGVNLFQYFSAEDFRDVTREDNRREYYVVGPSAEYGELVMDQAVSTLGHILDRADEAIAGGPYRATLCYGHDSQIIPLTALMGLEGCTQAPDSEHPETTWDLGRICPMGANVQLVFFRKKGSPDILVKVLLNEREVHVEGVETEQWPFYHWTDLRAAYCDKIERTPAFNRGGWQIDTVREGLVYQRYSGLEPISGAHQIISAVDVDLNNPRYTVKFTYGDRVTTSDAFREAGAVATINATYEKESVFIRVDGKTYHAIDSDIVPFAGAVPQWKTDSSISTDGREVHIAYTGKDLSLGEQRAAFEAIGDPNVFTSAPMLIDNGIPVGKYFAASSLSREQINALSYEDPLRHQAVRHPRSAAALTADNHLILIVVDGRRPGLAEGMNAFELTSFLEDHFHPVQAINLDGGGSTALCVEGEGDPVTHVVNYPSGSPTLAHDHERRVPTHIHILDSQRKP